LNLSICLLFSPEIFLSTNIPTGRQDGSNSGVSQQDLSEFLDRIGLSSPELEATFNSWRSPSNENGVSLNPGRWDTPQQDSNQNGIFFCFSGLAVNAIYLSG
jgi:hypothetical protein